jgi:hypothetical protein
VRAIAVSEMTILPLTKDALTLLRSPADEVSA